MNSEYWETCQHFVELSFSSDYFLVCNRVKHGTVLSQVLFSVYIDDLMMQLAKERKGKESGLV